MNCLSFFFFVEMVLLETDRDGRGVITGLSTPSPYYTSSIVTVTLVERFSKLNLDRLIIRKYKLEFKYSFYSLSNLTPLSTREVLAVTVKKFHAHYQILFSLMSYFRSCA